MKKVKTKKSIQFFKKFEIKSKIKKHLKGGIIIGDVTVF